MCALGQAFIYADNLTVPSMQGKSSVQSINTGKLLTTQQISRKNSASRKFTMI